MMPQRLASWFYILAIVGLVCASIRQWPVTVYLVVGLLILVGPVWLRGLTHAFTLKRFTATHPCCQLAPVAVPSCVYGFGLLAYAYGVSSLRWGMETDIRQAPFLILCALIAATYAGLVACLASGRNCSLTRDMWIFHPCVYQSGLHFMVCLCSVVCAWLYELPGLLILPTIPMAVIGTGMYLCATEDLVRESRY